MGRLIPEMRAWKKEKALEELKEKELAEATAKINLDHAYAPESSRDDSFLDMSFDFSKDMPKIEIELKR
jgi:hypothetical protein